MSKKIWRPFNTVGLVIIASVVTFVLVYAINAL